MSRRSKTQTRIVVAKEDWSVRSMPWQLVADGSSFYLHPERALYKVSAWAQGRGLESGAHAGRLPAGPKG